MRRMIIADAHVGEVAGDAERMAALVRSLPAAGFGELVLLGDAFQYLIGMEKFWTSSVRMVLEAWRDVREQAVRVVVLEGNRDFFLDAEALRPYVDQTGLTYAVEAGPRSFLFDHGDRVNQRDYQYRFWRRVSKSSLARLWARLLPKRIATRIVRSMEAKIATTNTKFRAHIPAEELQRAAGAAWAAGVDVVVWGHFHTRWELEADDKLALVAPAWLDSGQVLVIEESGEHRLERQTGQV